MKAKLLVIVFVLVLGAVLTSALVGVDRATAPTIAANMLEKKHAAVLTALGIEFSADTIEKQFAGQVKVRERGGKEFFVSSGGTVAFEISGAGVQGRIEAVVALSGDLKQIQTIIVVQQEETPGLGSRIAEKDFLDSYVGKPILPAAAASAAPPPKPCPCFFHATLKIPLRPGRSVEGGGSAYGVDSITGATLSCGKFEAMLLDQAAAYVPLLTEATP